MNTKFWIGMSLGLMLGVVVIAYSKDAQKAVEKGKDFIEEKIEQIKEKNNKMI